MRASCLVTQFALPLQLCSKRFVLGETERRSEARERGKAECGWGIRRCGLRAPAKAKAMTSKGNLQALASVRGSD